MKIECHGIPCIHEWYSMTFYFHIGRVKRPQQCGKHCWAVQFKKTLINVSTTLLHDGIMHSILFNKY